MADLPAKLRGATAPGIPYSPWQLLEHMRIAQWDIVEFSRNAYHLGQLVVVRRALGAWAE